MVGSPFTLFTLNKARLGIIIIIISVSTSKNPADLCKMYTLKAISLFYTDKV